MTFPGGALPNAQNGQNGGSPSQQGFVQIPMPPMPGQQAPQTSMPQQIPQAQQSLGGDHHYIPQPYFAPPQQQQQAPQQQQGYQVQPLTQQQGGFGGPQQQGYPQQQQQGYPQQQGQPQQQAPQQQGQLPPNVPTNARPAGGGVFVDPQGRMFGPGVPQELQGQTFQQSLQQYGMLRNTALALASQRQPQQQAAPQQQPSQGQVNAQAPGRTNIWTNPDEYFDRKLDEKLGQYLGPVVQNAQLQQVTAARDSVAQQHPEFGQYEADVIAKMQGLSPELLANPSAWTIAFHQAVGERALAGARGGQQPQQRFQGAAQQPGASQQGWQPAAALPAAAFFSESPSSLGNGGQSMDAQAGLTPPELEMARRFGLTPQQYAAGKGQAF